MDAVELGNLDIIRRLLEAGADANRYTDRGTALTRARELAVASLLVEYGARVTAEVPTTGRPGRTSLHWAAWKGRAELLKWLIKHARGSKSPQCP